ncbi:MAG: M23 family metallopeptidase [Prevotellaceae bacterium]|jgi:hypothetical protein|nr:M23 family metallopeptidase [Prevotellaceae bacterium]
MSKYQFNRDQLRFIEAGRGIGGLIRKVGTWVVVSMVLAVLYYFLFSSFFHLPEERRLIRERESLTEEYDLLYGKMETLDLVINNLEERDKDIYRTVFKSDPPDIGHYTQSTIALYQALGSTDYYDLVFQTDSIFRRLDQKVDRIERLFEAITASITPDIVSAIPDISPLREFDIHRVGATVGVRIHPYYKTIRMHTGLDVIVTLGTDVLAPAKGVVTDVVRSSRESGNTVTVEHAYGYKTVYAHLSHVFVRKGQEVTKGMIIARVGSSGMSLAPHLHYEIWKEEVLMNPIHFCYAQITPEAYMQLMITGNNSGQSLD